LDVNGGRLEVEGNYTISGSSYLKMTEEEDYVLVRGILRQEVIMAMKIN